jgi:hypothetical protein
MDHKTELLWCSNELIGTLDFIGFVFLSTQLAVLASKMFQLFSFRAARSLRASGQLFTTLWTHCRLFY